ncbi:hypothetical protein ACTMTI_44520 [Nonomuraea sp. H19]|uniref:hypothetical protein n=1 Tax=Nonomuraea sp. H19 TaxID=3452206 RepID=UPI003F8B7F24
MDGPVANWPAWDIRRTTCGRPAAPAASPPAPTARANRWPGALIEARDLLAEAAHRGLCHLPPTYDARLADAAQWSTALGLHRVAQAVTAFAATLTRDRAEAMERTWADAFLRLELALDLC